MSIIEKVLDKIDKDKSSGKYKTGNRQKSVDEIDDDGLLSTLEDSSLGVSARHKADKKDDKNDVSRLVGIDYEQLKKYGYLTPNTINITLSEQYRRIKGPILLNAFDKEKAGLKNRNLVMITSSIPGEGKSFTSFNLALSVAKEFNHTALYIDADAIKQTMTRFLGFDKYPGLTDFLMDRKYSLSEILLKTNIPNLTILPSGKSSEMLTELWSSNRMSELMRELSSRYEDRLVIFDTPPLLHDSSAAILTRFMGQIIIVIEAEKTPQHIIDETLQLIGGNKYVGLVLNKSNIKLASDYGYYNYVNYPKKQ